MSLADLKRRLAAKPVPAVGALMPPPLQTAEVVAMTTALAGIEQARRSLLLALSGSDQTLVARTTQVLLREHALLIDKMAESAISACASEIEKA